MMHRAVGLFLLFLPLLWNAGCANERPNDRAKHAPPPDWLAWQDKRRQAVAGTNGWTTLAGLHWLAEGRTTAGSDSTNRAVFPAGRAPGYVGTFVREGRRVHFEAAANGVATVDGLSVQKAELQTDAEGHPTRLSVGDLSVVIIERGDRIGLRVRDPQAPARLHFTGLKYFPFDPNWRLEGRFEPSLPSRTLRVADVLGGMKEFPSPGSIAFQYRGVPYRLDVAVEPDEEDYFVMFHDLTAGQSTYPSGRFLYVQKPDTQGRVIVDFNRAYTPPCGFTTFATCPLPPRQNWLPLAITAGELAPADHPR
jgi:uncharacterized protein (DUF1684 family)